MVDNPAGIGAKLAPHQNLKKKPPGCRGPAAEENMNSLRISLDRPPVNKQLEEDIRVIANAVRAHAFAKYGELAERQRVEAHRPRGRALW